MEFDGTECGSTFSNCMALNNTQNPMTRAGTVATLLKERDTAREEVSTLKERLAEVEAERDALRAELVGVRADAMEQLKAAQTTIDQAAVERDAATKAGNLVVALLNYSEEEVETLTAERNTATAALDSLRSGNEAPVGVDALVRQGFARASEQLPPANVPVLLWIEQWDSPRPGVYWGGMEWRYGLYGSMPLASTNPLWKML